MGLILKIFIIFILDQSLVVLYQLTRIGPCDGMALFCLVFVHACVFLSIILFVVVCAWNDQLVVRSVCVQDDDEEWHVHSEDKEN